MKLLVLAHLAATLALFGAIWIVQVVHYPLFAGVGPERWPAYAASHGVHITPVVGPLMLVELATAVALVWARPAAFPAGAVWAGLALVGLIWASTFFVQVPLHEALAGRFDAEAHRRLVVTNGVRTAAWTLRAGLALWLTGRLLPG